MFRLVLCLAIVLGFGLVPGNSKPAQAAVLKVNARLVRTCSNLPQSAITYATSHGLCGYGSSAGKAAARPYNDVYGNCGDSYIYIYNEGGGRAISDYGFIVYGDYATWRQLGVNWTNTSKGNSGGWGDWGPMFDWKLLRTRGPFWTNAGYVAINLNGWIATLSGNICVILSPRDVTIVT